MMNKLLNGGIKVIRLYCVRTDLYVICFYDLKAKCYLCFQSALLAYVCDPVID